MADPIIISPDTLPTAIILVSAGLHALVNLLWKSDRDMWAFRTMVDLVGGLILLPALFFVSTPTPLMWGLMVASSLVHYVYQTLVIEAYKLGDLSAVYPVARGSAPLMTALGAFVVLGERPAFITIVGIVILVAGIVAFAMEGHKARRADPAQGRAFLYALATGALIATYTLIDATGARAGPGALDYIAWFYVVESFFTTGIVRLRRGPGLWMAMARGWKPGLVAGIVSLGSYGLALVALRLGATAQIAALRETSVVAGTLLGTIVLGETFGHRRLAAATVVAAGAIVMHLA